MGQVLAQVLIARLVVGVGRSQRRLRAIPDPSSVARANVSLRQNIRETKRAVEQGTNEQHCPFRYPVSLSRIGEMTIDGVLRDAQYPAGLPVGLAATDPKQAISLAVR